MTSPPIGTDQELIERLGRAAGRARWNGNLEHSQAIYEAADALQSRRSEVERLSGQLAEAVTCLTWIASLGYGGAPDIAMRRAASESIERIAALSQQGKV